MKFTPLVIAAVSVQLASGQSFSLMSIAKAEKSMSYAPKAEKSMSYTPKAEKSMPHEIIDAKAEKVASSLVLAKATKIFKEEKSMPNLVGKTEKIMSHAPKAEKMSMHDDEPDALFSKAEKMKMSFPDATVDAKAEKMSIHHSAEKSMSYTYKAEKMVEAKAEKMSIRHHVDKSMSIEMKAKKMVESKAEKMSIPHHADMSIYIASKGENMIHAKAEKMSIHHSAESSMSFAPKGEIMVDSKAAKMSINHHVDTLMSIAPKATKVYKPEIVVVVKASSLSSSFSFDTKSSKVASMMSTDFSQSNLFARRN